MTIRLSPLLERIAYLVGYWCPACHMRHHVHVEPAQPGGAVWGYNGNPDKPTFTPSVRVGLGSGADPFSKQCHHFVRDGKIEYCGDSTHAMAGQTIDMAPLPEESNID